MWFCTVQKCVEKDGDIITMSGPDIEAVSWTDAEIQAKKKELTLMGKLVMRIEVGDGDKVINFIEYNPEEN